MPEVVTKYPDSLIKELKDVNGKCGEGRTPQILKKCPRDQFCALPTGEICVYDLKDFSAMTQISSSEWLNAVTGVPGMFSEANLIILVFIFGMGLLIGMMLRTRGKKP
jgi:hypothetical protein